MPRWPGDARPWAAAVLLAGCAFADGRPWGEVEPTLQVRFAPGADRLDPAGRVRTARDYVVDLERLELGLAELVVAIRAEGGPARFDPTRPPPGYGPCHGGHCHTADGRLIEYAEVEAETGGGPGAVTLAWSVQRDVPVGPEPRRVDLRGCDAPCPVDRGRLATVEVGLSRVRLRGRAFDTLPEARRRLPVEGLAFELDAPLSVEVAEAVSARIGKGRPVGVRLAVTLDVPPHLLDGLDFESIAAGEPPGAAEVVENLSRHATLRVTVSRTE